MMYGQQAITQGIGIGSIMGQQAAGQHVLNKADVTEVACSWGDAKKALDAAKLAFENARLALDKAAEHEAERWSAMVSMSDRTIAIEPVKR